MNEPTDKGLNVGPNPVRAPKSPWMPFSMLFAAISSKVPEKDMNLVHSNYELFKVLLYSFLLQVHVYYFSLLFSRLSDSWKSFTD